jgi:hypothetical protein
MLHYSILHNEKIFNSSKISLNISHLQAKDNTVSYRAIDIMASNSLLITENNKYLEFFSKKLSRIFYNSPFDLRKKVQYFLKNPNARKDMINIQNEITKKNFLWIDRVKDIEQLFGLKKNTINLTITKSYSNAVKQPNKFYQSTKIFRNHLLEKFFYVILKNKLLKNFFFKVFFIFLVKIYYFFDPIIQNMRFSIKRFNIFSYFFYVFVMYINFSFNEAKKKIKKY